MIDHNDVATPELIVRKAAALFREKSYHGTSMRDIGEAVGLDKSSLYYHFPSKQAILEEINRNIITAFMSRVSGIMEVDISPEEKLRQIIHTHVKLISENQDEFVVALTDNRGLTVKPEADLTPDHGRYRAMVTQIITEGVESGIWKIDSPRITSLFVLGVLNYIPLWYKANGNLSAKEVADRVFVFALSGLRSGSIDMPCNPLTTASSES